LVQNESVYSISHCFSGVDIGKFAYLAKYLLGLELNRRFCNLAVCAHRGSNLLPTSCLRLIKQAIVRASQTDYSHLLIVTQPEGSL